MQNDGFSLDDKRAEVGGSDLPDIVERFSKQTNEVDRKRTDQSFLVPVDEIRANDWDLSINRYKEIVYEEVEYDPPAKIIADIKQLDSERADALKMLEELLG